jgi:phosphatidylglycerol:prolipoprotein diacylglycerol transferase
MYPYEIIWGIGLYEILFFLGLVAALAVFSVYTGKKNMHPKAQNFYLNLAIAAIAAGYISAFLFQAVYNYFRSGVFEFKGLTFLGGLIGGAAVFLGGYKLFADEVAKKHFKTALEAAPCCVLIAHGLGRIGCFMAGCCHGVQTDSFLGVQFAGMSHKVYPTQLFEAAFLFIMFGVTSVLFFKGKKINLIVYLFSYGIFRFLIEFIRGDERGQFIIPFLSPSQTLSIVMVIVGAALLIIKLTRKSQNDSTEEQPG